MLFTLKRMTHNVERSRSIYGSILLLVVAIVVSLIGQASAAQASPTLDFGYHNYANLTSLLTKWARDFPAKTHLYSIGQSVQGRELWVLALANSQPDVHVIGRPEAKYIGNMHGNEVPSKEILLHLIDHMLRNQQADASVDYVMQNTRVHLLVSMNPDGFESAVVNDCQGLTGRANANGKDLNRNFPDLFECNEAPIQAETRAVIDWLESSEYQYVVSANFHGGTIVANYPFDNKALGVSDTFGRPNPTLDNDVFEAMARNYSMAHANMRQSPCVGENFPDGITNGAEWYAVAGGMQDFNYWRYGTSEITLEVSCCKYPESQALMEQIWLDNKPALLSYLMLANTGVRGRVTNTQGTPLANLTVRIDAREPFFKTSTAGEFYRLLLPGTYELSLALTCDASTVLYKTQIEVPAASRLLQLDTIVLDASAYAAYVNALATLDKYPTFCASSLRPPSCSLNYSAVQRTTGVAKTKKTALFNSSIRSSSSPIESIVLPTFMLLVVYLTLMSSS